MGKTAPHLSNEIDSTHKYSLEEAIELTRHGKFHLFVVIFGGFTLMAATSETISVSSVLPFAKCDLEMTTSEQGLVSTISYLGIVVSSHFWGFLADTWGRRKVLRLSSGCAFILSAMSSFVTNVQLLIALRCFCGVFVSGLQASALSYVSEFHTKEKAPRAASFAAMFIPISVVFLAVLGYFLIPIDFQFYIFDMKMSSWRVFVFAASLHNLINFIAFMYLPESPRFLLAMNQKEETLHVLQRIYATNTGLSKESYPVKELEKESTGNNLAATKGFTNILKLVYNQTKPIFVPPYLDSTVKLCYTVFLLFAIGQGTYAWFPSFIVQLQNRMGYGETLCQVIGQKTESTELSDTCDVANASTLSFVVMFAFGVFCSFASAMISFLVNKVGPRVLVPVWLTTSTLCCLAIAFLTDFYSIAIAFIPFLSCSISGSTITAISVNSYPTNIRAMATCFIFMFGRIGSLVGGNLIGVILQSSCDLMFYAFTVLLASCILMFLLIKKAAVPTVGNSDNIQKTEHAQDSIP